MRVYNKRFGPVPGDAVYVGRPSPWGNPFVIGRGGDRDEAIARFRVFASRRNKADPTWLEPLRGRDLVCWCAPLACHADVLVELVTERWES